MVGGDWLPVGAGLATLAAGVALRTWSIRTLGRLLAFVVTIQDNHRVVTAGPYRLIRHPSYSGGLLALAGIGVALDNWASLLILLSLPLAAILIRIRVEETALGKALGTEYQAYAHRTCRLIPGLW